MSIAPVKRLEFKRIKQQGKIVWVVGILPTGAADATKTTPTHHRFALNNENFTKHDLAQLQMVAMVQSEPRALVNYFSRLIAESTPNRH
jgi:hypothetical protein